MMKLINIEKDIKRKVKGIRQNIFTVRAKEKKNESKLLTPKI